MDRRTWALGSAAMAVVSADPAYAQSADTAIDDAIIVTAQRRQERTQDVPISREASRP